MLKKMLILTGLMVILALPAMGSGVDQVIYSSEEVEDNMGALPDPNEEDLFKGHNLEPVNDDPNYDPDEDDDVDDDPTDFDPGDGDNAPVPEPATGLLLGIGVLGLARLIRRKKS